MTTLGQIKSDNINLVSQYFILWTASSERLRTTGMNGKKIPKLWFNSYRRLSINVTKMFWSLNYLTSSSASMPFCVLSFNANFFGIRFFNKDNSQKLFKLNTHTLNSVNLKPVYVIADAVFNYLVVLNLFCSVDPSNYKMVFTDP